MKKIYLLVSIISAVFLLVTNSVYAVETSNNFRIPSASPVVYPYFDRGNIDVSVTGSLLAVSTKNDDMFGFDAGINGRYAFDDTIALDGGTGIAFMGGFMEPGLVPSLKATGYDVKAGSDGTVFTTAYRMHFNVEIQMTGATGFGLIMFFGPNVSMFFFNRVSDYKLVALPSENKYTDRQKNYIAYLGMQAGLALNIPLTNDINLSPFFMVVPFTGWSHNDDDPGNSLIKHYSGNKEIPSITTVSFGCDVHFREVSISPVIQAMQLSSESAIRKNHIWSIALCAGYRFYSNQ